MVRMRGRALRARRWIAATLALSATAAGLAGCVPEGFHEYVVFEGLDEPMAIEFSSDGRIFVAEKRGVVKVFDGPEDGSPTTLVDLRTNVFNGWDRGLLGLALPPDFPADPTLYVLYTYDAEPGGEAPRWGEPGADRDNCPTPPGWNESGCVVTGRLSRLPLDAAGRTWTGQEQVLVEDWCQQYPSHSIGDLAFGPDGALYASGGEGASFMVLDYGQEGDPANPCDDPPAGVGGTMVPATAEGGKLRSQDLRTPGDPTGLDGTVIRVDPETGAALPDNPLADSPDANARRIVAHGLRNPFRFTLRPGSDELWIGDVGWGTWEEIQPSVGGDRTVDNFGWPCYEGRDRQGVVESSGLGMCEALYAAGPGAVRPPHYAYPHRGPLAEGEGDRCPQGNGSSVTGLAFTPPGSPYPETYDGALFFGDASRGCIWVVRAGADGRPDPSAVEPFVHPAGRPVELEFGPGGELWYVDMQGRVVRIGYSSTNHPPVPIVSAEPSEGDPPLTVTLDASRSVDEDPGDEMSFTWDLDGDGAFDDATGATVVHTFAEEGLRVLRVRVRDLAGTSQVGYVAVTVGSSRLPVPVIEAPPDGAVPGVGERVAFSGWASDADGNFLPAEALSWTADLLHCPDTCHRHPGIFAAGGVASGELVVPDHEYPAIVELRLTAEDEGRTASVTRQIPYRGTDLTVASQPAGVRLAAGGADAAAPWTRTFSSGGRITLSAPAHATVDGVAHRFAGWSDGGAASHEITVPALPATYTALYEPL